MLDSILLDQGPGSVATSSSSFLEGWTRGVDAYVRGHERYDPVEQQQLVIPGQGTNKRKQRSLSPTGPPEPLQALGFMPDKRPPDNEQLMSLSSMLPSTSLDSMSSLYGIETHHSLHDDPRSDTYHGRKIKRKHRRQGERTDNIVQEPKIELNTITKRRAFLNNQGVLQFVEVEEVNIEEVAAPLRAPGFWTRSSWCKDIMTRQELKLVLPKSCSDFDEVPMMPCMSNKYVTTLKPIMRNRNKNWRQTSFRNVYVGRGSLARKKKKKVDKKDMFGSDEVKWVEGYPLRKKILHTESCLVSDEYVICCVHGVGITGRIYNEASNEKIPRGLEITVHTPEDCGMYQIKLEIKELPDLFHDRMDLLGPGKTKPLCSALVRMLYFEYSKTDPRKNVDEMPIFGGYGKNKYVKMAIPEDSDDENDNTGKDSKDSNDSQDSQDSQDSKNSHDQQTHKGIKPQPNAKKTPTVDNADLKLVLPSDGIVRDKHGVDHILLPDKMKILCISRGSKLNRRERRENWMTKRTFLRSKGVLPETPRPPTLPLRFIDRVYCGTAIRAGLYFYVSFYCYPERPNNYVIQFHHSISCTMLSYNINKKLCRK